MRSIANWKVKTKLAALVGFFLLGFIGFAAMAFNTLSELKVNGPYYHAIVQGKDLIADVLPPPEYIIEAYLVTQQMADPASRGELEEKGGLRARSKRLREEYVVRHKYWLEDDWLQNLPTGELRKAMVVDAYNAAERFFDVRDAQFMKAVNEGDYATARQLLNGPLKENYEQHRNAIDRVVEKATANNTTIESEANQVVSERTNWLIAIGLGIIVLSALMAGFGLGRSIASRLDRTANTLSETSMQIASTIEEQERTAMQQSEAVQQTTAAMDELGASFHEMAGTVKTAAETAGRSQVVANEGIQKVQQTLEGMMSLREKVGAITEQITGLSEQTSQIGTITKLVSDVANQTNLLALNAAVEAARAGEHGRGFGVVAGEIRRLADQSKSSAERISALVKDIQKATNATVTATEEGTQTVEKGIQMTHQTVTAFNDVAASSSMASEAAQQALHSVPQQVTAVKQVVAAMESLSAGAQESAVGISQTRAGIENLRETSHNLKEMI